MRTRANVGILVLVVCVCSAAAGAADIYVDADAPGANNGASWVDAYHYLQDALAVAQPDDTIKVAQGTYKPNQATAPSSTGRSVTFTLLNRVTLLGGFAGYGASPSWPSDDRDPQAYPTTLSGDLSGNDPAAEPNDHAATGLLLSAAPRQDNSYNVVTAGLTGRTAILDGFRIVGGNANGATATRGGGILSQQGSPTIRNCVIQACAAANDGGGLYASLGDPNVSQCTFMANYAGQLGAGAAVVSAEPNLIGCRFENNVIASAGKGCGLYNQDSNSLIQTCTFKKNTGGSRGGAFYSFHCDPNVVGCTFTENAASVSGGAAGTWGGGHPRFTSCQFVANTANQEGGAADSRECTPRYVSCLFIRNRSLSEGGAVYAQNADANLVNCVLNGNKADYRGGGLSFYESDAQIINCTFSANTALTGQALTCDSSLPPDTRGRLVVVNGILWDSGSEIENRDGSDISVTYSTVYGNWSGIGNRQTNPLFVDSDGADNVLGNEDDKLGLSKGSLCIDAGKNQAVPSDIKRDVTGKKRFIDDPATTDSGLGTPPIVDMGAYEYGTDNQNQNPPVANAGPDQSVHAAASGYASVTLDGSASYDPDGSALLYSWTWTIGSQTYSTTGVKPAIQLPVGQHYVNLVVFDGTLYSDPDTVRITVLSGGGSAPVANAGQDRTVYATGGTASVMLDGSGSYDPEGSSLQYNWTWTIGSQTYNTTGVKPTVQLPVGQRSIQLIVFDGTTYSSPDTVVITVVQSGGSAPVANAGQDKTVTAGTSGYASVMLDGSGSYDPEGSSLQYTWTWTIGSQTYSATGVKPTLQLPVGQRTIQLVVYDGVNYSDPDTVVITVVQTSNSAPVANAGQDKTAYAGNNGYASVVLDGSGSYDPEGSSLQYNWTWTIGGQSYSATGVKPTVLLPVGQRSVQLIVYDGTLYSNPDTVVITVLQNGGGAPVANAGQDRSVYAASNGTASVMLDGSSSYDPEGSSLQYTWTWTVGSQSYSATGIRPTIQLPVGQRTIQLVVFDGINYSDPDTVVITVLQSGGAVPIAHAGQDRTVTAAANGYATVMLDGSASYDPEGSALQYTWTWTVGGLTYSTTGVKPTIQLPVGQRTIQLIVSDGVNNSAPDTVVITVVQNGGAAPVANAGPDRTAYAPAGGYASVALDGSASYDPEGSVLQYTWTWTVGDQAFEATGATPTIALPLGQYVIELVVFDGVNYSAADSLQVSVVQPLVYPLYLSPYHVSLQDSSRYVIVLMVLPEIGAADVDLTIPLALSPGNVRAFSQHASEQTTGGLRTTVVAMFYEEDVLNAIPDDGPISVTVTGQLTSGQSFQGTASFWLIH